MFYIFEFGAIFYLVVSDRGEHSINIPHWMLSECYVKGQPQFTFLNLAPLFLWFRIEENILLMVSDRGEHYINIPHWMLSEIVTLKGNHAALFTFSNLAPFFVVSGRGEH